MSMELNQLLLQDYRCLKSEQITRINDNLSDRMFIKFPYGGSRKGPVRNLQIAINCVSIPTGIEEVLGRVELISSRTVTTTVLV
ncbi:hypothetical protein ZWY2020_030333 [Hordeum vulgare]|nr:hypothetical protein ZWY2020_030333 [Hordeum vulgare]